MPERQSHFKTFLTKLRKRHIIETFAGFIAGGWLILEFVDRILVAHYHIHEKWIDVAFFTLMGMLINVILWRWFQGTENRPGSVKIEVLTVPLISLLTLTIDLNIVFQILGIVAKTLFMGIIALCLGIAWIIFKLYQWAASTPDAASKTFDISKLVEIKPEKSIVVLPFADLSPQKDQEYFCDGMTEEIITDLSHIHELRVISRNSAMMLKGTPKDTGTIGRELNVQYVLEGSVRKAGNDLKITAQLIDAINDAHLWAEKYAGTLDDVFEMQEKVSRSIVEALRLKLTRAEDQQIAKRPLVDIRAYDCYLRARRAIQRFTEEGFDEATRLLQAGLNIVGDNALLYAGLGYAFLASADLGMKPMNAIDKAGDYARKALSLDPDTSQAHMVLGYVQMMHGNQGECIRRCKQALSINPNDYDANMWLGMSLCFVGKTQEAIPIANRMIELDPLNPSGYWIQTFGHFFEGRFVDAYESLRREPTGACLDVPVFRFWAAYSLAYSNRIEEALALLEPIKETATTDFVLRCFPLLRSALQGDHRLMAEMVTADIVAAASIDCMKAGFLTSFYAMLGDKESTFKWLETAIERGLINYPFFNNYDPFLAKLHGDPRFKKLMKRVKYEWEHFEV